MGDHFFKSLEIENFRGIKSLKLNDLARVNLFVGANSCGKTSVLESLFLLTGMSNPSLIINIENWRGLVLNKSSDLRDYFYGQNHEEGFALYGEQELGSRSLKVYPEYGIYPTGQLSFKPSDDNNGKGADQARAISSETGQSIVGLKYRFKDRDAEYEASALWEGDTRFLFQRDENYKADPLGRFLTSKSGPYEANLVDKMFNEKHKDTILRWLKPIEPKILDIQMNRGGVVTADIGIDNFIPVNLLGDGLVRILQILSSVYGTENGILMIDEMENGLHVSSVRNMWKMIVEHSELTNTQVFMSTHSKDVIEGLAEFYKESDKLFSEKQEADVACFYLKKNEEDEMKGYRYSPEQVKQSLEADIDVRH